LERDAGQISGAQVGLREAGGVETSAAEDDSRPVLTGIYVTVKGDRLTLTTADGFRLSTAHATLDEPAHGATAIQECDGLVAFAKCLKPKVAPRATIDTDASEWRLAATGTATGAESTPS
jgi:hypothetical protein